MPSELTFFGKVAESSKPNCSWSRDVGVLRVTVAKEHPAILGHFSSSIRAIEFDGSPGNAIACTTGFAWSDLARDWAEAKVRELLEQAVKEAGGAVTWGKP
jgi:hypothetical protein